MKLPLAIALTLRRAPSNELPCGPKSLVTHTDTTALLLVRTSVPSTILPSRFAFSEILFQPPDLPHKSHHFHTAVPAVILPKLVPRQSRETFHLQGLHRKPPSKSKLQNALGATMFFMCSHHQSISLTPFSPGIFSGLPNHAEPQQKDPGDNPGTFLPGGQFGFSLRSSHYLQVQKPEVCS